MFQRVDSDPIQFSIESARGRQTPDNTFGAVLERGAQTAVAVIGSGVRAVAPLIPGGSFLSAVVDVVDEAVGGPGATGQGSDKWALLRAQERLQEEGLANSLRLLALQQRMQQESQSFTASSNVMKTRHDMAMAAINNMR